mmetsp:Transcript_94283/g.147357  ORF Transcript_94283/g.147357 Transcript_94283/m.147357 type:complete len:154 (+) Transcript_94283:87-548(+)
MLRFMVSSASPAQYFPKFLGAVVVAISLAGLMLHISPSPPDVPAPRYIEDLGRRTKFSMRVHEKLEEHKAMMRREEPPVKAADVAPRPEAWGKLMRREGPLAPAASAAEMSRMIFFGLFGLVALLGFGMQLRGALVQLMDSNDVRKYFGLKSK